MRRAVVGGTRQPPPQNLPARGWQDAIPAAGFFGKAQGGGSGAIPKASTSAYPAKLLFQLHLEREKGQQIFEGQDSHQAVVVRHQEAA